MSSAHPPRLTSSGCSTRSAKRFRWCRRLTSIASRMVSAIFLPAAMRRVITVTNGPKCFLPTPGVLLKKPAFSTPKQENASVAKFLNRVVPAMLQSCFAPSVGGNPASSHCCATMAFVLPDIDSTLSQSCRRRDAPGGRHWRHHGHSETLHCRRRLPPLCCARPHPCLGTEWSALSRLRQL